MGQRKRRFPFVRVSDHALLRFIERAGGLDVAAVRRALQGSLTRASTQAAKLDTADFIIVADGLKYIVVNNVVVTIVSADSSATVAPKGQRRAP